MNTRHWLMKKITYPYENEMQSDFGLNGGYIAPNAQAPRINLDTAPLRSIQAIFSKTNQAREAYQEVKVAFKSDKLKINAQSGK